MGSLPPDHSSQPLSEASKITRGAIDDLQPFVEELPIGVTATTVPLPLSVPFALHMGEKGMKAFNAAYETVTGQVSRDNLVRLARRAVDERGYEDDDDLPPRTEKKMAFSEAFLLSLLSGAERARVLGRRV